MFDKLPAFQLCTMSQSWDARGELRNKFCKFGIEQKGCAVAGNDFAYFEILLRS